MVPRLFLSTKWDERDLAGVQDKGRVKKMGAAPPPAPTQMYNLQTH